MVLGCGRGGREGVWLRCGLGGREGVWLIEAGGGLWEWPGLVTT